MFETINKIDYDAVNAPVLAQVPLTARRILDLGCGTGALGRQIKLNRSCEIVGVTYSQSEAEIAHSVLDQVVVYDLNAFDPSSLGHFDCIICSHVLEHLYSPHDLLLRIRGALSADGVLIVGLPNVLFWKQRVRFLRGQFKYTEGGLMDSTHFRFFDWSTALQLVQGAGYKVASRDADGFFPLPILRRRIEPIARRIDKTAASLMPGFFGYQFVITARLA